MEHNSPKCWYCQEETLETGKLNYHNYKPIIYRDLITFNGEYWHRPCLKAYRKVRAYLASQPVQNPLSDNLLNNRKPEGVTKYGRTKRTNFNHSHS